jgi:hypothetical protein
MQTMESYEIASGDEKCIPHTLGDIVVSNSALQRSVKYYIDVNSYVMEKGSFFCGLPCISHYSVHAKYSADPGLVVVNMHKRN